MAKSAKTGSTAGPALQLQLQLLGPLAIVRGNEAAQLPKSRKVRALIAYLALARRPLTRSHLCELLWDSPSDPRGELRWCLSKARTVLDDDAKHRIVAEGDTVALELNDCRVDAVEILRAMDEGLDSQRVERLQELSGYFHGEFLEGAEFDSSPQFNQWVIGERRRFSTAQITIVSRLAKTLPFEQALEVLEKWVQLAPLDCAAHELLLQALVTSGRLREAEEHLGATIRLFELEGVDWLPIREAWRAARQKKEGAARVEISSPSKVQPLAKLPTQGPSRSSVAVLPFLDKTSGSLIRSGLGDGLSDDIITRLAKLRVLTVIARGSAFAMSDRSIGTEDAEVGQLMDVSYVANGTVRRQGGRIVVSAALTDTANKRIIWADEFSASEAEALTKLDEIGDRVVASIAEEVETAERNRAILKPPNSLDAWEAYHRGLWHMYRFNDADNGLAAQFFHNAVKLDPTFSRAYSALSFTHFQNAFLHWRDDRQAEIDRAYESAGQSVIVDDRDPAAHLSMGRALWLRGQTDQALGELQTSVDLSPNFALAHYTVGFVHCQSGDPEIAIDAVKRSQRLSPFDPLLFAMLGTHALSHVRLGNFDEAANWSIKAAARPNAHAHILSIAAHCLSAAGRVEEARRYAEAIRKRLPQYGVDEFLRSFRFNADAESVFRQAAQRIGFT